jgi:hypothetical protein
MFIVFIDNEKLILEYLYLYYVNAKTLQQFWNKQFKVVNSSFTVLFWLILMLFFSPRKAVAQAVAKHYSERKKGKRNELKMTASKEGNLCHYFC